MRRDPQPPMPIVMPLSIADDGFVEGGPLVGHALLLDPLAVPDERVAVFICHAGQVQFERKALLHPVTGVHLLHIDEIQGLLGGPDHPGVLGGNVARDPKRGVIQVSAWHYFVHRPEVVQRRGVDGGGGEEQPAHHVLGNQP